MHATLCICALIPTPPLVTRTRLVVFIHHREEKKPTNTGRLATECIAGSTVVVRGRRDEQTPSAFTFDPSTVPVLLFPAEDATPLADFARVTDQPVTLVVPDGNWRQASKVRARVPGISALPCVMLPRAEPTTYRLRHESHHAGLATIEAIARALGVLEGIAVQRALERVFHAMVERTLWTRGALATEAVASGIPDDVVHRARA